MFSFTNNTQIYVTINYIIQTIHGLDRFTNYLYTIGGSGDVFTETDFNSNITWTNPLEVITWSDMETYGEIANYLWEYEFTAITNIQMKDMLAAVSERYDSTITASGLTGAKTINKYNGSVNFAASATSLVVTNDKVTPDSIIQLTVASNDANMTQARYVAGTGSFTIYPDVAPDAETRVVFSIVEPINLPAYYL